MKITASFVVGILAGLAFSRIPHYIEVYANHSLPPPYEGPKMWGPWTEEEVKECRNS